MSKIGFPAAMVCWLLASVAFVEWLNGGVEYINGERVVASAPGTGAIVLTSLGVILWLLGKKVDTASQRGTDHD